MLIKSIILKVVSISKYDQKKMELNELIYKEKRMRNQIHYYQQELSDIKSKIKLLEDSKVNSQNKQYFLNKLSLENDYRDTFQKYFEINEYAHLNLFDLQNQIATLSNELKNFQKTKNGPIINPDFQPILYGIREKIIKAEKDIETLEKEKHNIQNIQIIQPPTSTELPKTNKTTRYVIFFSVTGFFVMVFLSFFVEYLKSYKKRTE
jgi:hypothetical protein